MLFRVLFFMFLRYNYKKGCYSNTKGDFMKILTENLLFQGLDNTEIQQILNTVRHNERNYSPGETIVRQGDIIDSIGIFLGIFLVRIVGYIGRKTIFSFLSLDNHSKS